MTNLEKLEQIGTELFGPNWITPMARMLNINDSTIRRWLTGKSRVSETIANDLPAAIERKFASVLEIANSDLVSGDDVDIDKIVEIVDNYDYVDEMDRQYAIDAVNNAVYEKTYLSNLYTIARNFAR